MTVCQISVVLPPLAFGVGGMVIVLPANGLNPVPLIIFLKNSLRVSGNSVLIGKLTIGPGGSSCGISLSVDSVLYN